MQTQTRSLPAPGARVGTVDGPCVDPRDNAGTVLCHVTDRWGTHALVLRDTGKLDKCTCLTQRGIGWYVLGGAS